MDSEVQFDPPEMAYQVPEPGERVYVGVGIFVDPSGNRCLDSTSWPGPPPREIEVHSAHPMRTADPRRRPPETRAWVASLGSRRREHTLFLEGGRYFVASSRPWMTTMSSRY
ncbi:hypothetical protein ACTQ2Q_00075 [Atopobiaceae bacterium LCP21S3_F11]